MPPDDAYAARVRTRRIVSTRALIRKRRYRPDELLPSDDPLYQCPCWGELLLVVHRIRALGAQRP